MNDLTTHLLHMSHVEIQQQLFQPPGGHDPEV